MSIGHAPTVPFGTWKSPITSDLIVAQSIGLSEIRFDGPDVYWLESRPHEAGRCVVVSHSGGKDLVPPPINVRTRVHEYGGGAWTVAGAALYYSDFRDQRLYCLDRDALEPRALTPEGSFRYADGVMGRSRGEWVGVREDHSIEGREPVNTIVRVSDAETRVLLAGHDFYSSPRLSPDGHWLAWLEWDHPRMPWVGTTLCIVRLGDDGTPVGTPVVIAGSELESVFQPEWSADGSELYFVSDRTGWWNLYRCPLDSLRSDAITQMQAEFGQPQWVFGMSTYAVVDDRRLVCSYTAKGLGHLAVIDITSGRLTALDLPFTDFSSVRASGNRVVFRAGSAVTAASYVLLDLGTGETKILKQSTTAADDTGVARYFTRVETVEFPTEDNRTAFGLYYPAYNPDYQSPPGEKPPLLVKCHGGPTASASSTLDLRTQYWTSRGISVLDVNYGGSSGFGREYRDRLDGRWGIVDVDDCVNGARHLADQGLVDGRRCVITGGSAGGFTVLVALTSRHYFAGGASYYGVSDLAVLARDTHKFESRYLDSLVGPYPEQEALYRERSAATHADLLRVPVIFFQGEEDMVVPPNQTEIMVAALRRNGIPVGYLLYSGEQHGFRKAANIKRSLDAELYFYASNVFQCGLAF